jgi:hypothetical protein
MSHPLRQLKLTAIEEEIIKKYCRQLQLTDRMSPVQTTKKGKSENFPPWLLIPN